MIGFVIYKYNIWNDINNDNEKPPFENKIIDYIS